MTMAVSLPHKPASGALVYREEPCHIEGDNPFAVVDVAKSYEAIELMTLNNILSDLALEIEYKNNNFWSKLRLRLDENLSTQYRCRHIGLKKVQDRLWSLPEKDVNSNIVKYIAVGIFTAIIDSLKDYRTNPDVPPGRILVTLLEYCSEQLRILYIPLVEEEEVTIIPTVKVIKAYGQTQRPLVEKYIETMMGEHNETMIHGKRVTQTMPRLKKHTRIINTSKETYIIPEWPEYEGVDEDAPICFVFSRGLLAVSQPRVAQLTTKHYLDTQQLYQKSYDTTIEEYRAMVVPCDGMLARKPMVDGIIKSMDYLDEHLETGGRVYHIYDRYAYGVHINSTQLYKMNGWNQSTKEERMRKVQVNDIPQTILDFGVKTVANCGVENADKAAFICVGIGKNPNKYSIFSCEFSHMAYPFEDTNIVPIQPYGLVWTHLKSYNEPIFILNDDKGDDRLYIQLSNSNDIECYVIDWSDRDIGEEERVMSKKMKIKDDYNGFFDQISPNHLYEFFVATKE